MAKRRKPRRPGAPAETAVYRDDEGNLLELRSSLSKLTIRKINSGPAGEAASVDDSWQRRSEMLFERLVVNWEISGIPLDDQKMLLGRYRMASSDERRWVIATIEGHLEEHIPELAGGGTNLL